MEFLWFLLAFVILSSLTLFSVLAPVFKERKTTNGVYNKDPFSKHYLFRVSYGKQEFIRLMYSQNGADVLSYIFDENTMVITFFQYNANIPYAILLKEFDGGCYIKLSQSVLLYSRCNIPLLVNEVMIKKFRAEPLPYEEYIDIVT